MVSWDLKSADLWLVGLPAIFWFYMNKGRYFQNWKKAVLTITNILVLAIAFAIVSILLDSAYGG